MTNTGAPPDLFRTSVGDIARLVQGESREQDAAIEVAGFASLGEAQRGDVAFYHDVRYAEQLRNTRASVVLVPPAAPEQPEGVAFIRVANPSAAFDLVVDKYGWQPASFQAGVHPRASVAESARFDPTKVSVGANATIAEDAVLADGVTVGPGCYVGRHAVIGKDCHLHANVTVQDGCILGDRVILHSGVVIGGDGFGYEFEAGRHRKVKQRGIVQIDADVEIGANSTVDRARYGRTWIGTGTKIDNLVQIGHNAIIGKHCILVACVAVAGSAVIGDYVIIGAQVGIAGHVKVGSQARLAARCGVTKDLEGGKTYLGFPAVLADKEKKRLARINRLDQLFARVQKLEKDGEIRTEV